MSSDLIALVVAITLGVVVIVLGLRRNLSATTRNGLPRFGGGPKRATPGLYEGGERRRHPASPRERRWLASLYLLLALMQVASAVQSPDERVLHAGAAALMVLGVAVLILRKSPHSPDAVSEETA